MKYSEWLIEKLNEKNMSQSDLAQAINKSKSCVSDWVNGVSVPIKTTQQLIEKTLDIKSFQSEKAGELNVSVEEAAELMGVKENFVEEVLKQGKVDWGIAVKVGSRTQFHISRAKFNQYMRGDTK